MKSLLVDRIIAAMQIVIHKRPEDLENMPDTHASTLQRFVTVPGIDALGEAINGYGGRLRDERRPGPPFVTANAVGPGGKRLHLRGLAS